MGQIRKAVRFHNLLHLLDIGSLNTCKGHRDSYFLTLCGLPEELHKTIHGELGVAMKNTPSKWGKKAT